MANFFFLNLNYVLFHLCGQCSSERLFSQANLTWSDKHNHITLDHVKTEIQIKTKFRMICLVFYYYVRTKKRLLKTVKSNSKYNQ